MKYIIAHYNEDLKWVKDIDACIISKGVHVPNIGRETSSYFWWIIGNYHKLPDVMAFRQGNPKGHKPHYNTEDQYGQPYHWEKLPIKQYADDLGLTIPEQITYITSAQFQVTKEEILKHPFEFYVKAYKMSVELPQAPWVFERLFMYIWNVKMWTDAIEPEVDAVNLAVRCFTSNKYKEIFDRSFATIAQKDMVQVHYAPDIENNMFGHADYNKLCYDKAEYIYKSLCELKDGDLMLFFDSDVMFFTPFEWFIGQIKDNDIVFQKESLRGGYNAGFMLVRNSQKARDFLKRVADYRDYRYHDQHVLNVLINLTDLKVATFATTDVFTYGYANRGRLYEGNPFNFPRGIKVFHANYCVGDEKKKQLMDYVKMNRT